MNDYVRWAFSLFTAFLVVSAAVSLGYIIYLYVMTNCGY